MRAKFFNMLFLAASLLFASACSTADVVDLSLRETSFNTDSIAIPVARNTGWGVGLTSTVEGDLTNGHLMYSVDKPELATVLPGDYTIQPAGFSPTTGKQQWSYNETIYINSVDGAVGKVTVTVWPPSSPWLKKRLIMNIGG